MPYFYECEVCGGRHGFNPNDSLTHSELPERACDHCGENGCVDCVHAETGLCATCHEDGEDRLDAGMCRTGCLACLNEWSHG